LSDFDYLAILILILYIINFLYFFIGPIWGIYTFFSIKKRLNLRDLKYRDFKRVRIEKEDLYYMEMFTAMEEYKEKLSK